MIAAVLQTMRHATALAAIEWRRRQGAVVAATALALVSWATALTAVPSLRDGTSSAVLLWSATSLFAAGLAASAFAPDVGDGRLEFLYANGASPVLSFLARASMVLLASAGFAGLLHGVEWTRLLFYHGEIRQAAGGRGNLGFLRMDPREGLLLYALPSVALLLFFSSVASRTSGALATAAAVFLGVVLLDATASRHAEAHDRIFLASIAWSLVLVPAAAALAAVAVWLRRIEPERASVRVVLWGATIVLLGARYLVLDSAGEAGDGDRSRAVAVSLSPDGKRIAVEGARTWRPTNAYAWAAAAAGREPLEGAVPFGSRVVVAGLDGSVSWVSEGPMRLERGHGALPWLSHRYLRVEGVDPKLEASDARTHRPLLFDADRKRVLDAPAVYRELPGVASQRTWQLPKDLAPGTDVEVCRIATGSVRYFESGELVLVPAEGERKRLWPPPEPAAPPTR